MASVDKAPVVGFNEEESLRGIHPDPRVERANRNVGSKRAFFSWFDPNDGPAERQLILKLDFFILSYAFIGFWVRYPILEER